MGHLNADLVYTIAPARYAKGKVAVQPAVDGSGMKTTAACILSLEIGASWSNRERAYICSPAQVKKFEQKIAAVKERRRKLEEDGGPLIGEPYQTS